MEAIVRMKMSITVELNEQFAKLETASQCSIPGIAGERKTTLNKAVTIKQKINKPTILDEGPGDVDVDVDVCDVKDGTPDRLVSPLGVLEPLVVRLRFCRLEEKADGGGGVEAICDDTLETLLLRTDGALWRRLDLSLLLLLFTMVTENLVLIVVL